MDRAVTPVRTTRQERSLLRTYWIDWSLGAFGEATALAGGVDCFDLNIVVQHALPPDNPTTAAAKVGFFEDF